MDDLQIVGRDDEGQVFKQILAHYDVPAFVRRARATQAAYDALLERCRRQRDDWLRLVRFRFATLHALAGDWARLRTMLADDGQLTILDRLAAALVPTPAVYETLTTSNRVLRRALRELVESITFFNQRWQKFLANVDLAQVNALRDGYNRYYVLEKECALRSPRVARQGFQPLAPVTVEEVAALFPPLPCPRTTDHKGY